MLHVRGKGYGGLLWVKAQSLKYSAREGFINVHQTPSVQENGELSRKRCMVVSKGFRVHWVKRGCEGYVS